MELLDLNNTITFRKFKCLDTNQIYEVVQTECTDKPRSEYNKYPKKSVNNSIDTIVRSDGLRKSFTRKQLKDRFTNIEGIPEKDYLIKKKKKR